MSKINFAKEADALRSAVAAAETDLSVAISNGHAELYKTLGKVYAFAKKCFSHRVAFLEACKDRGVKIGGKVANPFTPVVKFVFGEWETKEDGKKVWKPTTSASSNYPTPLRFAFRKDITETAFADWLKDIGGLEAAKSAYSAAYPNLKATKQRAKKLAEALEFVRAENMGAVSVSADVIKKATPVDNFVMVVGELVDGKLVVRGFKAVEKAAMYSTLIAMKPGAAKPKKTAGVKADNVKDIFDGMLQAEMKLIRSKQGPVRAAVAA